MACRTQSTMVCCGNRTVCVSNEGDVYSFGLNSYGELGNNEYEKVHPVQRISSLRNIRSICCGRHHTVCLDNEGNVFTFGRNNYGQLGVGANVETAHFTKKILKFAKDSLVGRLCKSYKPLKVDLPPIKQISCGMDFTMCISEDGGLYSFGINYYGQLGNGDRSLQDYPKKIESLKDIDFVECGNNLTLCKTKDGDIYGWGKNDFQQLGIENDAIFREPMKLENCPENIVDIKCGIFFTLALTASNEVYFSGFWLEQIEPSRWVKIVDLSEIIRIECASHHLVCIDINNNLFFMGKYSYTQQEEPNNLISTPIMHPSLSNIIDISTLRGSHTIVKTSNNEIYAFGRNNCSQFGITTNDDIQSTPIQVLKGLEDIWVTNYAWLAKVKSARK